jgi:ubiquinone biosynthesis protein
MTFLTTGGRREGQTRRQRNRRRVRDIVAVAVRYGFGDHLPPLPGYRRRRWLGDSAGAAIEAMTPGMRLRLALTELGTTFIKFGQMLSTRADLVGHDMARELAQLQSGTQPDPPGTAEATIARELGRPPAELFASFDPTPFASASIAQVHHAQLKTGEHVVVKVQKTGIEERIEADLAILADVAELFDKHGGPLTLYHPVEVVRQFTRTLRGELDFTRELHNLQQFGANFAADRTVHFPVPFAALSTRRVLTMERLEGVLVSRITVLPGPNPEMDEFARRGANVYMEMIFRDAFYHADPHPGNLMLLAGGVVGVLDCGMVQRLDEGLREAIEDLLLAAVHADARTVTDAVWDLCTPPPGASRERLHADITELIAEYGWQTIAQVDVGALINSLIDIIHSHRLFLPAGVSLLLRMLGELEGTARMVNPSFGLFDLIEPYAEQAARRRLAPARVWLHAQRGVREWGRFVQALPHDLNDMMQRMRTGSFSVHLDHRRLDPVVNRLVLGVLTASVFLGSSLLWSARAAPVAGDVSLVGAAGYLLALVMGVGLLRAIWRSEHSGNSL